MLISLCVIALNEESTVGELLEDFAGQDYDKKKIEVILVDGGSKDKTPQIFEAFKREKGPLFADVAVLSNPGRTLPCGWNVALRHYRGEAILRVDAHARIPSNFVRKNVDVLAGGEDVCGGFRPTVLQEKTPWRETLLMAENSMFGSSIAPYRQNHEKTYVKSLFHAAYRREVFEKTGGFNENLKRTEDNEMHYRMRKAGYRFCFHPEICSCQYIRSDLKKMLRQKYGNGYWIGVTAKICPACLSLYHFVPFAFVTAIALTGLGSALWRARWIYFLTGALWGTYWGMAILMAILAVARAGRGQRSPYNFLLPPLFFLLHASYGAGTFAGLCKSAKKRHGSGD